jgi:paraquat-inducible protein B
MSEKPHTIAIGAFVIGACLITITIVLFLLGSGFGKKEKVVMVFDGSARGLNVGAPMALRGVKVGQVTDVDLVLDADTLEVVVMVEADFEESSIRYRGDPDAVQTQGLINRGLRAQLNTQSLLTGLLYIELDFHPQSEVNLPPVDSPYLQLPTIPTNLERLAKKLQEIDISKLAGQLESISDGINSLVSSEEFQGLPADLTSTLDSLRDLSSQLQEQLASTGPKLDTVLDETAATVSHANMQLPKLTTLVEANLKVLEDAITSFEQGMSSIEGLASPDSATLYQLNNALQEMTRAGRSLQSLANTLEQQPESLIQGKRGDK